MKKILLIALLATTQIHVANAQSFSDIKNKKGTQIFADYWKIKIYGLYTDVASKYTPSYSGYTFNVSFYRNDLDKWGTRTKYENSTLGDLFWLSNKVYNVPKTIATGTPKISKNPAKDHAHGSGFLGWLQYYTNVIAKDRTMFSVGLSAGDYIYGSRVNGAEQDPYGYYLVAGPAVMASYVPAKWCWVDVFANYELSYVNAVKKKTTNPKYPKPHFLTIGADFNTSKQFFFGIRHNTMIDRGTMDDSSSRLDIKLGFIFPI